jgi:insertion element IS1 protein InsB
LPDHLNVEPITSNADIVIQRLEVEADEMASFMQNKANKQWIWLAMDAKRRQFIGFHVEGHSRKSARKMGADISPAYRQQATFYTDQQVV